MKQSPRQTQSNDCSDIAVYMKCMYCTLSKYDITVDLIIQGKKVGGWAAVPELEKSDTGLTAVSWTWLAFFQLLINLKGAVGHTERELYKINDKKGSQND